jgi:predicted HD phosphohydrolase
VLRRVDELFDLLRAGSDVDDGEEVDLLSHGLQCAALLAGTAPEDPELQVAGLVHDIGLIVDPTAEATHPADGARMIEALVGPRVARLVAGHVDAKRHLVHADAAYRAALSPRSRATLETQGGAAPALDGDPDRDGLLALRRADDAAKVPGRRVPGLEHWRPLVRRLAGEAVE